MIESTPSVDDLREAMRVLLQSSGMPGGTVQQNGEWLRENIASLLNDRARLNALEGQANAEPLLLHRGDEAVRGRYRGLALRGIGRSLRQAVDQAFLP